MLTRMEAFVDTEPRLAENTHGQEQGNCGHFLVCLQLQGCGLDFHRQVPPSISFDITDIYACSGIQNNACNIL